MARNLHIHKDPETLARFFAEFMLENAPDQEQYTVALSGGSTPKLFFQILVDELDDRVNWDRIHFFWGDERCVPPDDAESNYGAAKEILFDKVSIPEANVHRIFGEDDPATEAARYGNEIKQFVKEVDGLPQFDLIILGMGEDGHTASIFPNQMGLLTDNNICALAQHPDSGQQRISLTGPVINNAAYVAFLITGEAKADKVAEIVEQGGNAEQYPAAHIMPTTGQLHWFLDEAATKALSFVS